MSLSILLSYFQENVWILRNIRSADTDPVIWCKVIPFMCWMNEWMVYEFEFALVDWCNQIWKKNWFFFIINHYKIIKNIIYWSCIFHTVKLYVSIFTTTMFIMTRHTYYVVVCKFNYSCDYCTVSPGISIYNYIIFFSVDLVLQYSVYDVQYLLSVVMYCTVYL